MEPLQLSGAYIATLPGGKYGLSDNNGNGGVATCVRQESADTTITTYGRFRDVTVYAVSPIIEVRYAFRRFMTA